MLRGNKSKHSYSAKKLSMHPIAFRIFGHPVHWYGIMMATGFLLAYLAVTKEAKRRAFPLPAVGDILIAAMIGGVFGARIYYLISYWDEYYQACVSNHVNPYVHIFFIHEGGLVFLGGFIGAALLIILYCWWRKINLLDVMDFAAIGVPIGHAMGRVGCFLNGCCFGRATDSFLGFSYPRQGYGYIFNTLHKNGIQSADPLHCHPIYPVQLFAVGAHIIIFIVIFTLSRTRFKDRKGHLFPIFLMLDSAFRFINEFFRGDYDPEHRHLTRLIPGGLTEAQILLPWIFLAGLILWFMLPLLQKANDRYFSRKTSQHVEEAPTTTKSS
ncbi:MAG: prolipoprotein diacylglyceryl transferase [Lentisphaerae bacterium]|nr:MAG: prolipoprotein diacylglyceryl transferase [Lentisphaerota bacterium]